MAMVASEVEPILEKRVLERDPLIMLGGAALHEYELDNVECVQFGTGIIAVSEDKGPFTSAEFAAVVLSTLGYTAEEAAGNMQKSAHTIKVQWKRALIKVRNDSMPDIESKAGLARYCFANGIYKLHQLGDPLDLLASEERIVQSASYGKTAKTISKDLKLPLTTVSSRMEDVCKRNRLRGKERIILGAFLSGQIRV